MHAEEARALSSGFPEWENNLYKEVQLCIKEFALERYSKCVYSFRKGEYTQECIQEAIKQLLSEGYSVKTGYNGPFFKMEVSW